MVKNDTRKNLILLLLFVFAAGIYNYGLKRSFWFDYEYVDPIYKWFMKEKYDLNIDLTGIVNTLAYIPYKLFGCSQKAIRVHSVITYCIVMLFTTFTAMYSKKHFEWYRLGIFAFITVILHPGSTQAMGHYSQFLHQYLYDLHIMPVFFATFSVMLLLIHQEMSDKKHKAILKVIILVLAIVGYKKTDFLYVIDFVGPMICAGVIWLWNEKRKLLIPIVFGIMIVLALLHVISFGVPALAQIFIHQYGEWGMWRDGSVIYGNNAFADFSNIWRFISTTIVEVLALFNIDISNRMMLSLGTFIAGFRLILVILMFILCFRTVINAVCKKKDVKQDPVDVILALAIIFNVLIVMFSEYGDEFCTGRYMTLVLFYGAIFMARQSEDIIVKLGGEINNKYKMLYFSFFSLAIIINMTTFWKPDDYVPAYESAMSNVDSLIREKHLGNGIGSVGCATTLTLVGKGEYTIVNARNIDGELKVDYTDLPTTFNYLLDWRDSGFGMSITEEDVERWLGKPDIVYEVDGFMIYYYYEGFNI